MNFPKKRLTYFSIEIAVALAMLMYSGGLGILADDTLPTAAKSARK
jgi:glucan phosphorylase